MAKEDGYYHRDLPHFTPNDSAYFVTYRLAGTLPTDELVRRKLRSEAHGIPFRDYDRLLDSGTHGPHWLKLPALADIVKGSLHYWDGTRYKLWAYTIMSNHVHVVLTLHDGEQLWDVLHSLKSYSANKCNQALRRRGEFWQHESYDHVVRSNEFGKIIFYVLRNPVKAGLVKRIVDWPYSYVSPDLHGFDDTEYQQASAFR